MVRISRGDDIYGHNENDIPGEVSIVQLRRLTIGWLLLALEGKKRGGRYNSGSIMRNILPHSTRATWNERERVLLGEHFLLRNSRHACLGVVMVYRKGTWLRVDDSFCRPRSLRSTIKSAVDDV